VIRTVRRRERINEKQDLLLCTDFFDDDERVILDADIPSDCKKEKRNNNDTKARLITSSHGKTVANMEKNASEQSRAEQSTAELSNCTISPLVKSRMSDLLTDVPSFTTVGLLCPEQVQ
jgi:hypothetical protein